MTTYRLSAEQFVARPRDEVFAFFADPRNLGRITPPGMRFELLSDDLEMREGLEIEYRLRPLLGVPVGWRTLISAYDPPHGFSDVQVAGPYRHWVHRHSFRSVDGGTVVEDQVDYELPLGRLGGLGHWLVRSELEQIFRHRARTIESVFSAPTANAEPRTIAVAGGTGFVGGAIALELFRRGHRVVVLSSLGEAARRGLPNGIEIRTADVTDSGSDLVAAIEGTDGLVVSLAFRNLPIEAPRRGRTFEAVDAAGTERLVAAAGRAGTRWIVYVSGAGAAPDAERHWFRAKWRAEQSVRGSEIDWTIIRPTWIYGPRDVSLNRFLGFARRLLGVPLTNFGGQRLAPVFVDDMARLAADSIFNPAARDQVFELGGPETVTMREVIGRALRAAGIRHRPIIPGPGPLIKLAIAPLTLLPEPPLTPAAVDFVNQPATVDIAPLLARMPRRLTPLDEGLATYLAPDAGPGRLRFGRAGGSAAHNPKAPASVGATP